MIPAASKPALRSSLTRVLDPGRGGADHHGGADVGEQPGGGETDAVGAARPGDHRHPAGQVKRRWDGHGLILVGLDARSPGPREGGGAAGRWPAGGPRQDSLRANGEAPDPLESAPPAFGEQAARQILREGFGVESLSLKPLAGEREQNFRVDTAAGQRFLFKISNPADDGAVLEMQAAALRHIERVDPGLPVMRALPAGAGESWVEVPGPDSRTYPARLLRSCPGR